MLQTPKSIVHWAFALTLPLGAAPVWATQLENSKHTNPKSLNKNTLKLQEQVAKCTAQIRDGMGGNKPTQVLQALQQLKTLDLTQVVNPWPLLQDLMVALQQHELAPLRLLVAQQARQLVDTVYVLNKQGGDHVKFQQREEAVKLASDELKMIRRKNKLDPFAHQLDFELQRLRAAVGVLDNGKNLKRHMKDTGLQVLQDLLVAAAKSGSNLSVSDLAGTVGKWGVTGLQKTYKTLLGNYRKQWYSEAVYLNTLKHLACDKKEFLRELQQMVFDYQSGKKIMGNKSLKLGSDDWQKFYGAIEALAYVAQHSPRKELALAAFVGLPSNDKHSNNKLQNTDSGEDLPGLQQLAGYRFTLKNKWRVQAKVAHELVLLAQRGNPKVQQVKQQANKLLQRLQQVKDKKVQVILQQRQQLIDAEQLLQQAWDKEVDLEKIHNQLNQLYQNMSKNLQDINKKLDRLTQDPLDEEVTKIQETSDQYWQVAASDMWRELEQLYIAPRSTLKPDMPPETAFDSTDYVLQKFLPSKDKTVLLVIGEGGSGKSTFVQMLEKQLWQTYKTSKEKQEEWIPIYIPFTSIDKPEEGILQHITNEMSLNGKLFPRLQRKRKVLVILDGYDEWTEEVRKKVDLYSNSNNEQLYRGKVIVTSRPSSVRLKQDTKRIYPRSEGLQKIYAASYGEKQVKEYLRKFLTSFGDKYDIGKKYDVDWYLQQIKKQRSLSGSRGLSRSPVLLRLLAEVLPSIVEEVQEDNKQDTNKQQDMTETKLFEAFVKRWFKREWDKIKQQDNPFEYYSSARVRYWHYAMRLADALDREQVSSFKYKAVSKKNKKNKKKEQQQSTTSVHWKNVFSKIDGYTAWEKKFVFRALPIYKIRGGKLEPQQDNSNNSNEDNTQTKRLGDGNYRFWHLKLQDFFKSKKAMSYSPEDEDDSSYEDDEESDE